MGRNLVGVEEDSPRARPVPVTERGTDKKETLLPSVSGAQNISLVWRPGAKLLLTPDSLSLIRKNLPCPKMNADLAKSVFLL